MARRKISYIQLEQLVSQGYGVSQIAQKIGVSKGTVSKALKKLNVAITKDIALRSAGQITDEKLDAMAQLRNINQLINDELNHIEKNIKTATERKRKELQDQKLKHVAEIRKQLSLLLEIAKTLYNAEEVANFQKTVLEVIGSVSPSVRNEIERRLVERGTLARSLGRTPRA